MSDTDKKSKPGFFGRLFGRSEKAPTDQPATEQPQAETAAMPALSPAAASEAEVLQSPPATADAGVATAAADPAPPASIETAATESAPATPAPAKKASWFQRLKDGLTKTSAKLSEGITSVFTKRKLDAETLEDFEDLLIQADLGVETAARITATISKGRYEKGISADEVRTILAAEVQRALEPVARPLVVRPQLKPHVILVVGVNGTGKTTTIGKLAALYRQQGLKVMVVAGDTFRAAAIDQLKVWGERSGATVLARAVGSDSSGLAYDAVAQARSENYDVVLMDTAGRLQNKAALMDELEKVIRVIKKIEPQAPHDVLLVLDATTGQNAMSQVEVFRDRAGVSGLVMTKLDGTARGGILVAIAAKHQLPVHAIGVGEGIDDLQPFSAGEFARAIALS